MVTHLLQRLFVYALAFLIVLLPGVGFAAELSIDATKKVLNNGDTFIANIRINAEDECINTASVDVFYDPSVLTAVDFSQGESLITLWIEEPTIDNNQGLVHFAGGIPGGYCGRVIGDPELSNTLGRIIFTTVEGAVAPAETISLSLSVASTSQVLLNDGLGTPANVVVGSIGLELSYTGGPVVNDWLQSIRADIIAPEAFEISVQRNDAMYAGKYFIAFSTIDKQTGVNHYEILETNPSVFGFDIITNRQIHWREVKSPYMLRDQSLSSKVLVKAIDEAGNERIATFEPIGKTPLKIVLIEMLQILVIFGFIMGFGYLIYRNVRGTKKREPFNPQEGDEE